MLPILGDERGCTLLVDSAAEPIESTKKKRTETVDYFKFMAMSFSIFHSQNVLMAEKTYSEHRKVSQFFF